MGICTDHAERIHAGAPWFADVIEGAIYLGDDLDVHPPRRVLKTHVKMTPNSFSEVTETFAILALELESLGGAKHESVEVMLTRDQAMRLKTLLDHVPATPTEG